MKNKIQPTTKSSSVQGKTRARSDNINQSNRLRSYKKQYQKYFISRTSGQILSETEISWILSTIAHMRCSECFSEASDTLIAKEAAN